MGGQSTLSGPDLRKEGLAAGAIVEGRPVLAQADGEAVMVVRRGTELFAVGATCTHYGGPLSEGVIEADHVRCPWHHACFSLRTGEPVAPAHNPISCWNVEQRDGKVFVGEKRGPAPKPVPSRTPSSVVIVGGGAAGHAAAEMLRREGYAGPVTVLSEDASEPYDRPNLSKDYLAGNAPEEWIPLRPPEFYKEQRIALRLSTRVAAIDARGHTVTLESGEQLPYGALLLATGSTPVHLEVPGAERPHVHVLRSLAHSRAIIAQATKARRAVVVGSSFIGLEVAASLRTRNVEVEVVTRDAKPLERVMGTQVGEFLQALHESKGVRFHFGRSVRKIDEREIELDDGTRIAADLVVAGIGVRPNLELAKSAGLEVDRGVRVNEFLETSAPGVWAAGDVARFHDARSGAPARIEHWVVAQRQGQIAAKNMLGAKLPFRFVPFFWSNHYDVVINYLGHAEQVDRIDVDGDLQKRDATVRYVRGGKTLAIATLGRDLENLRTEVEWERAPG
jgi:NADPH-dependent 2,4-dienoyl-CoA reductase/sulfur reductase-like enzyme/nitrite reductase/ring-hydroxylating ferredoxin subunit